MELMHYSSMHNAYFGKCAGRQYSDGKIVRVEQSEWNEARKQGSLSRFEPNYWAWQVSKAWHPSVRSVEAIQFDDEMPVVGDQDQVQLIYDLFLSWCSYRASEEDTARDYRISFGHDLVTITAGQGKRLQDSNFSYAEVYAFLYTQVSKMRDQFYDQLLKGN